MLKDFNPEFDATGIDLGTTECCTAVIRKHGPDFVALDPTTSNRTLPSYVGFDEKEPKCGKIVVDRMRNHANCTVYDTKRIMGREFDKIVTDSLWPFNVINANSGASIEVDTFEGKKIKSPEVIAAVLLAHIKSNLESYQGRILSEAVITIPSGSTDEQMIATAKAAELAGWETVHFLPEPIAAAFAYFTEKDFLNNCNILICDCGGGTVDICVAKISNGKFELLNYDGDSYLGGRDFDKLLFNYFETILKHTYKIDISKCNKKYLLNQMCQNIKHNLSTLAEDTLAVDSFECDSIDFIPITREEFEILALPLILKMKDVILRSISKANLQKDQINYVFQVGGGCRMPMIKKMLKEIFPNSNHQCSIYPDWVVAHGAALYAYHLKKTKANGNKSPLGNRAVNSLLDKIKGIKFRFLPPKSSTNATNIPA
uniref:Heat shock protein 70 n=1 Tax=Panagrolaimus davidi TaxID=227884 RepID=A0A914Q052_9BILA